MICLIFPEEHVWLVGWNKE